jgi:hypothetical protein
VCAKAGRRLNHKPRDFERDDGQSCAPASLTSDRKLHFARLLDHFRGLRNFKANHATIVAEIGNNPGTNLITFLHARLAQRWLLYLASSRCARPLPHGFTGHVARPSRSILVVLSLHAPPSYFANFVKPEA